MRIYRRGPYGVGYSLKITTSEIAATNIIAINVAATEAAAISIATKSTKPRIRLAEEIPKIKRILAGQDAAQQYGEHVPKIRII